MSSRPNSPETITSHMADIDEQERLALQTEENAEMDHKSACFSLESQTTDDEDFHRSASACLNKMPSVPKQDVDDIVKRMLRELHGTCSKEDCETCGNKERLEEVLEDTARIEKETQKLEEENEKLREEKGRLKKEIAKKGERVVTIALLKEQFDAQVQEAVLGFVEHALSEVHSAFFGSPVDEVSKRFIQEIRKTDWDFARHCKGRELEFAKGSADWYDYRGEREDAVLQALEETVPRLRSVSSSAAARATDLFVEAMWKAEWNLENNAYFEDDYDSRCGCGNNEPDCECGIKKKRKQKKAKDSDDEAEDQEMEKEPASDSNEKKGEGKEAKVVEEIDKDQVGKQLDGLVTKEDWALDFNRFEFIQSTMTKALGVTEKFLAEGGSPDFADEVISKVTQLLWESDWDLVKQPKCKQLGDLAEQEEEFLQKLIHEFKATQRGEKSGAGAELIHQLFLSIGAEREKHRLCEQKHQQVTEMAMARETKMEKEVEMGKEHRKKLQSVYNESIQKLKSGYDELEKNAHSRYEEVEKIFQKLKKLADTLKEKEQQLGESREIHEQDLDMAIATIKKLTKELKEARAEVETKDFENDSLKDGVSEDMADLQTENARLEADLENVTTAYKTHLCEDLMNQQVDRNQVVRMMGKFSKSNPTAANLLHFTSLIMRDMLLKKVENDDSQLPAHKILNYSTSSSSSSSSSSETPAPEEKKKQKPMKRGIKGGASPRVQTRSSSKSASEDVEMSQASPQKKQPQRGAKRKTPEKKESQKAAKRARK